ncbi:Hypothetical predicted protein [Paramuricea clavata]|uniref:Uncharacterized protein n=1 Tax=Paramuricea clavata TaxID=317549 RepID=A0A6S7IFK3_PARCT|nr:Hypothetical predicted protein [Paramuricea clavata]
MDAGQGRPTSSAKENYEDENVKNGGAAPPAQQGESRMMATASTLAGENPAIVHEPGTDSRLPIQETLEGEMLYPQPAQIATDGRPPIQEIGEGEMFYPQPAQIGSDISGYYSVDVLDLEEELEVLDIMDDGNGQPEILVMSVETSLAIVAGL